MGKQPMNAGMKALKKEAPEVAAKMGYMYGGMAKKKKGMAYGGMMKKGMAYGGMMKKGFKDGGLACGADVPAKNPIKRGKS